ncbi:hypothetical protein SAMN05443549_10947 [Flavobacterium fluvii]|uniref:Uncharacterized protein n=1 Tax=Flavobacterium fluvii TaxID=468056 RepID=A0A1M5P2Y9_9FLAO|nr:hypothetical protein [Flavobacterium fluvii]SHG96118.1 hypothetical protein SAMN05443549_10947 [Flavobacterium fluvii]
MDENNSRITSKIVDNGTTDKPLNTKWDKCLIDYNNYTKEYIKHYKKSIEGNSNSLSKYPYMKAKSEALCAQLFDAQEKNFLTKKQIKMICKIQIKIANTCLT